jgi:hypothetical protein
MAFATRDGAEEPVLAQSRPNGRILFTKKNRARPLEACFSRPKSLRVEAHRLGKWSASPTIVSMLLHGGCGYANL